MNRNLLGTILLAGMSMLARASADAAAFDTYMIGNSLTTDMINGGIVNLIRSQGYSDRYGYHLQSGANLQYLYSNPASVAWEGPNPPGHWNTALPGYHWDAVTLQVHVGSVSLGESTLTTDVSAAVNLIAAARSNLANNDTQFLIYMPWASVTLANHDSGEYARHWLEPTTVIGGQELTRPNRAYYTDLKASLHTVDPSIEFLETGELFYFLDQRMQTGAITGFNTIEQLYRDDVHLNEIGQSVAAWTAYATLLNQSPVGLPYSFSATTPIDPLAVLQMQQTVWQFANVPEPASASIIMLASLGLGTIACRRSRRIAGSTPPVGRNMSNLASSHGTPSRPQRREHAIRSSHRSTM